MKTLLACLSLLTLTYGNGLWAQDSSRGKTLFKTCVQCHGNSGEGKIEKSAPRIGGQHDWYIYSTLNLFKSGTRKNPDMNPYIANLTDQDFKDLAAYVSKL
ncbi:MAG: cytochrome c [Halobacteriovoraceae bacterium]|jgi:cytochrome c553|nr:cytochrome c [Halobacteriovoraceae bacterium]MBT5096036.1 cytochrome c [Halobacteriovoraceae bacterium]